MIDVARLRKSAEPPERSRLARFESLAVAFHRATGMMAPGKDVGIHGGPEDSDDDRRLVWETWCRVLSGPEWCAEAEILDEKLRDTRYRLADLAAELGSAIKAHGHGADLRHIADELAELSK